LRAKGAAVDANLIHLILLGKNLPSGYNKDSQEMKKSLMSSFETTILCLKITQYLLKGLKLNTNAMKAAISDELFSAQNATILAVGGVPFREAYLQFKQA
jgi:argininosuccinate lyase